MQPPEARFAPQSPLSYSEDIWSLAFAIWEIIGMKAIFSSEFATADDIIAQQIDVLGASSLPLEWWEAWEQRSHFFSSLPDHKTKHPKEGRYVWPPLDEAFEEGVQRYRRQSQKVKEFEEEEMAAILKLMCRMLAFQPEDRLTAEEVLQSEWMVKWALPEFYKTLETI
jgi:serine/threonine protein kinase